MRISVLLFGERRELTKHLPGFHHTVEVMKNCSRGWPERISAFPPNDLGVEHRSDRFLIRCCCTNTSNVKVLEVYAKLSPLDIRTMLPMNVY